MRPNLASAAAPRSLVFTLACCALTATWSAAPGHAQDQNRVSAARAAPASDAAARAPGLPADLLPVPGGKVTLGSSADQLLEITKEFQPRAPKRRVKLLRKLMSELGPATITVEPFYLQRYPVTNEQYLQFVNATGHRSPFHWWKFGKPEHYKSKLKEAREAFKDERNPDLIYWEKYGRELEYAIPPGEEQHPVVFVSWRDAAAFAAWAGGRLPSEAEWVFAATGGKDQQFLWGDEWSDDRLQALKLANSRDKVLKAVGTLGEVARGPFGHGDLVANVWEWTDVIGYYPVNGAEAYERELRKVQKRELEGLEQPDFNGSMRIVKGGSYFSWADPAELRVQSRAYLGASQTVEGCSFRIAKSDIPGRDTCRTRIVVEYDMSGFSGDRKPNLDDQIGIERYDLSSDGRLITGYHTIGLVPVDHMGIESRTQLPQLEEEARQRPLLVATLVTTEKLADPKLEPGIYSLLFRPEGMPKELVDALREGSRVLRAERQKQGRGATPDKEGDKEDKDGKDGKDGDKEDWRQVLDRYGITSEEAAEKGAESKIEHVVLKPGDLRVSTAKPMFVLRNNEGEYVAAATAPAGLHKTGKPKPAELALGTKDNAEKVTFDFHVPWSSKARSQSLRFTLPLLLSSPPDVSRPWRLPANVELDAPRSPPPSANSIKRKGR